MPPTLMIVRLQTTTVTSHESATGTEKEPYQRGAAIRIEDHMVTPIGYGEIRGEPVDHIKHRGDQEPSRSVIHDMAPPFRSTHYKPMHYQIKRLSSMSNPSSFHHFQCPFHRNAAPIVWHQCSSIALQIRYLSNSDCPSPDTALLSFIPPPASESRDLNSLYFWSETETKCLEERCMMLQKQR